ncbi:C40 family peptidase [Microcella indica]|uniref:C40 family peptidase n=1 Tax=Microcella indica TaxID=2750620 RepID=UPI0015CF368D|nr:C40 family peptidase [Microcella indica]
MRRPGRRGIAAVTLVTALTVALGVTAATAAPAPPSWDDVEQARGDVQATQLAIARIEDAARAAEQTYLEAARSAVLLGEEYHLAELALEQAEAAAGRLEQRRDAALDRAAESGARAAQLAAQLARSGSGDLTTALLTGDADDADDLLYRLGAMSSVGARSQAVMARAMQDKNTAEALTAQAELALAERERLAAEAADSLAEAITAADRAEQRLTAQQTMMGELAAQLASLTGRSEQLERDYLAGLGGDEPAPGIPAPGSPAPGGPAPSPSAPPSGPAPSPSSPPPAPGPSPSIPPPSPSPSPSQPSSPNPPSVPAPNAGAVATAISFASAQVGEPYQFGGRGPNVWDCSGLTMQAYAAAGVAIGGHSATRQYSTAAQRDRLVPYAQAQPGDLIFYSTGGATSGSKYHVTLYIGGGQMIEAPYPGKTVRIVAVRSYDRVPYVARPTP